MTSGRWQGRFKCCDRDRPGLRLCEHWALNCCHPQTIPEPCHKTRIGEEVAQKYTLYRIFRDHRVILHNRDLILVCHTELFSLYLLRWKTASRISYYISLRMPEEISSVRCRWGMQVSRQFRKLYNMANRSQTPYKVFDRVVSTQLEHYEVLSRFEILWGVLSSR